MAKRAVCYLRVSGASQIEGDGFPRQRDSIDRFAKANDYKVIAEYRDEGVSGKDELTDRDGLTDLIDHIAGNGVRVVIVESADRIARKLMVQETILDKLRQLRVTVLDCAGNDLTVADDDPTRKLVRQILGAVAEFDRAMTVAKLRKARERKKRETGRCDGRKPFGEREGEAETLERIRQLRRKPRGGERPTYDEIAATLNKENRSTRKGSAWARGNVHAICKRIGLA